MFRLQIIGVTPNCRANIRIEIPIIIGTSPIRDNIDAESVKQNTNSFSHSNSNRNDASTSYEINGNGFGNISKLFMQFHLKYIFFSFKNHQFTKAKLNKQKEEPTKINFDQSIQCTNNLLFTPVGANRNNERKLFLK